MTAEINDPVAAFKVGHALAEWRKRGTHDADLIMILRRDLQHCRRNYQPASARNIERMLEVLEASPGATS